MAILVTGGAGFIGSHTAVELLNKGKEMLSEWNPHYVNTIPISFNKLIHFILFLQKCCDQCISGVAAGKGSGINSCEVSEEGKNAEQLLASDAFSQCCKVSQKILFSHYLKCNLSRYIIDFFRSNLHNQKKNQKKIFF